MIGITLAQALCLTVTTANMPNADVACTYMDVVMSASEAYDLDPEVMVALIHQESRWRMDAVSSAGACGLTQVLPKYAKISCYELKDPVISIWIGAKMLSTWLYKFGRGDYRKGLCGYNGGYWCGVRSRTYARSVLRRASRLNRKTIRRINRLLLRKAQKLKIRAYVERGHLKRHRHPPKHIRHRHPQRPLHRLRRPPHSQERAHNPDRHNRKHRRRHRKQGR